jgi:hypothetical protein
MLPQVSSGVGHLDRCPPPVVPAVEVVQLVAVQFVRVMVVVVHGDIVHGIFGGVDGQVDSRGGAGDERLQVVRQYGTGVQIM